MQNRLLLISNLKLSATQLQDLRKLFPQKFDYVLHSQTQEEAISADLRKVKNILSRISHTDNLAFYLEGALELFVVKNFAKQDKSKDRKVFFISSYLTKFLPEGSFEEINESNSKQTLAQKYKNAKFVRVFLTEQEYERYLAFLDEKKSSKGEDFRQLVVPFENVISGLIEETYSKVKGNEIVIINDISKEHLRRLISQVNNTLKNPFFVFSQSVRKERTKALSRALYSLEQKDTGYSTEIYKISNKIKSPVTGQKTFYI